MRLSLPSACLGTALLVGLTGMTTPAFADTGSATGAGSATTDATVLATDVNASLIGQTGVAVLPGQILRSYWRVANTPGAAAIPANAVRLSWSVDKGATFSTGTVQNVFNAGSANRGCSLAGAQLACLTQSNTNSIAASGANNYSHFYPMVQIPADAVPGTVYAVTGTLTFDSGTYTNVNPNTTFTTRLPVPLSAPAFTGPALDTTVGAKPTITGTGVAGATVHVLDGSGAELGTTIASSDGSWSFVPAVPLPDGPTTLSAWQHSVDTDSTQRSSATFVVDATAPDAPVITGPGGDTILPGTDTTVTGTGEEGAHVIVRDDRGGVLCETEVSGGTFSCEVGALPLGSNRLSVTLTDGFGNESSPSAVTVTVADAPVDPVTPVDPTDPVEPVDPTEPVTPIDPGAPIDPVVTDPSDGGAVVEISTPSTGPGAVLAGEAAAPSGAPVAATTTPTGERLAFTGTDRGELVAGTATAGVAILAGLVLLLARRRRAE
ncbi:hypothetical protein GCM10025867_16680 [Frondihabitans sucicola]|uniref:Bacterial Ig domain-containing protein n=1 Tax=Frondihabitans sucicola TaxID=1268041 RepID=A0ABN6XZZ9_9MICO|nr:Ig-like domain-containing protein [Frondihabitans sucicola]BDZ49427.1 hypothetical protein GCM10025867_16680 [Frondihabitans sucicola]